MIEFNKKHTNKQTIKVKYSNYSYFPKVDETTHGSYN